MFRRSSTRNTVKPLARTEGLSVTISDDETLVYDRERFVIHRLSPEMATLWKLADGTRDLAGLAAEVFRDTDLRTIDGLLLALGNMGLMQGDYAQSSRLSRRILVGGAAGAAAMGTFIPASAASECNPNMYTTRQCTMPNGDPGKQWCNYNATTDRYEWDECMLYN